MLSNNRGQERYQARALSLPERSPTPNTAKTPPLAPSGSPSPSGSTSEVSSHRPRSLVFEHGAPSGKALVIDLSSYSDEKDVIADTSHNFEFA
jgi:hypothetical protein